jgi:hypothetical protein
VTEDFGAWVTNWVTEASEKATKDFEPRANVRRAHNLKVVGSNPTPATSLSQVDQALVPDVPGFFIRYEAFPATPK